MAARGPPNPRQHQNRPHLMVQMFFYEACDDKRRHTGFDPVSIFGLCIKVDPEFGALIHLCRENAGMRLAT